MKERGPSRRREFELPPELRESLRGQEYACLLEPTSRGPIFVLKAPGQELATMGGSVPLRVTHELHSKRTAPVIRSVVAWYDRPNGAVHSFDVFTDVADPRQAEGFRRLAKQSALTIMGYDEQLRLATQKKIPNLHQREMAETAELADKLRWLIPDDEYDFAQARARVVQQLVERGER